MSSSKFTNAIDNENQYREASKTLAREKRPPAVLRMLMNSFESYRQARKYGWSRPWNKVDLASGKRFPLNTKALPLTHVIRTKDPNRFSWIVAYRAKSVVEVAIC